MLANRPLTHLKKLEGDVDAIAACNAIGIFKAANALRTVTLWGMCYHKTIPDLPWEHVEELSTRTPGAYALAFMHRATISCAGPIATAPSTREVSRPTHLPFFLAFGTCPYTSRRKPTP